MSLVKADRIEALGGGNPQVEYNGGDLLAEYALTQALLASFALSGYTFRKTWVTATNYAVNDVVVSGGLAYLCLQAHTAGNFGTDLASGRWQEFTQDAIAGATSGVGNFIQNGSFEFASGIPLKPRNWIVNEKSGGTITVVNTTQVHGQNALEFVGGAIGSGDVVSDIFPVAAGKELMLRFFIKASASGVTSKLILQWFTFSGTVASTAETEVYAESTNPTTWTEKYVYGTPPNDAAFAKLKIDGALAAGTVWVDDVRVGYRPGLPPVANHIRTGRLTLLDSFEASIAHANKLYFNGNITKNTNTKIGPTGSGADYEWSVLDQVPLTASGIILAANLLCSTSTPTADTAYYTWLKVWTTDGLPQYTPSEIIYTADYYGATTTLGATNETVNFAFVPLSALNEFMLAYDTGHTTVDPFSAICLLGWIE